MKPLLWIAVSLAAIPGAGLGLALWLGGPAAPPTMAGIAQAFHDLDYSALPEPVYYSSRDGTRLAYRHYPATGPKRVQRSVVLVHGSSATSKSMHPMAGTLADAGYDVYALDIRGHGDSSTKGQIDHVGQLEEDLADFVEAVKPPQPRTLTGFSSGGGFVLRYAATSGASNFQSFLLLSPFLHQNSPSQRENSGGWVSVGIPRLVALSILNQFGLTQLNHLPVTRFAIDEANRELLTASYDFNLSANFRPLPDYQASIRAVSRPLMVLAGDQDEAFYTDRFASIFAASPGLIEVQLLPGIDHAGLIVQPAALRQAVAAVNRLQSVQGARKGQQ